MTNEIDEELLRRVEKAISEKQMRCYNDNLKELDKVKTMLEEVKED